MNCSDALPLLDPLYDGALDAATATRVLDHVKGCGQCQSEWQEMEELHTRFRDARESPRMPVDLMSKVGDLLKAEERAERRLVLKRYVYPVSLVATACVAAVVGFMLVSRAPQFGTAVATTSADILIDALGSERSIRRVADKDELGQMAGYDMKFLRIPDWHMVSSGIYRGPSGTAIARFDFISTQFGSERRLICYQARQGMIRASGTPRTTIGNKRVLCGSHGKFRYALWSQNDRDYLFIAALPERQLQDVVLKTE